MLRAGVVGHPAMWSYCGNSEIQELKRKNELNDYERLQKLVGAKFFDQLRSSHKEWVEEYLWAEEKDRQDEWTGKRPPVRRT